MKQESVNSFNGGLNYDLNPITTPNDVLTDCVNGTFITFNGDELALQNDAGNTTIDYLNTKVQLSPGFYPLAIKEYGGILYIISGKEPTIIAEIFNELKTYNKGVVVYKDIDSGLGPVRYFYESLIDSNGATISYESNKF
ncbi:MAG: hypothetical protein ACOH2V_00055 [Candidatus Saccharimonadaceae bacterium]